MLTFIMSVIVRFDVFHDDEITSSMPSVFINAPFDLARYKGRFSTKMFQCFSYFSTMLRYSLEAPRRDASNEYHNIVEK